MNEEAPLHELYEGYRSGRIARAALESALFSFVRNNPRRFKLGSWTEEDREEFIAELYPTIRKTIDRYRDTGSCFDAYAYSAVRWEARAFRGRRADAETIERAYWRTVVGETAMDESDPYTVDAPGIDAPGIATASKRKRQILALTLKCCCYVSEDFCGRIAPALGLRAEELQEQLNGLRTRLAERESRRGELEERAAAEYCRGIVMAAKAADAPHGSAKRLRFERAAGTARQRHGYLKARAERISMEATNREVAETLGVPKGTIDASLFFLKKRCGPLHDRKGPQV